MSAALAPSFVHPEWIAPVLGLWLLLGAALLGAALEVRRRGRRLLGRNAGPLLGGREALLMLAAAAIALALLGPRLGTRSERVSASGVDLVVLLDVSRSMDARDVPPSRLDRARQAADRLLAGLDAGDRAALAAFAGRGVVLSPLTRDHEALRQLLPVLDSSLVRPAASRLDEGVRKALDAFGAGSDRPRVLLVLSDGEDPDREGALALPELLRAGVRVVSVAFGTDAGATIPSQGLELRDRRGSIVTTRRDAARLAALAEATGGVALATDAFGAVDAEALRAAVRRDAPQATTGPGEDAADWAMRRVPAVRVAPFAALALLLLLGEAIPRGRAGRAAAAAALGVLAFGADQGPHEPQRLLGDGLSHAGRGEWNEAERAFRAAAVTTRDPALAAEAYYDAGVAALAAGRLEAARDVFLESLALDPASDARFNLEWTLRALAAPPPRPPGSPASADESEREQPRPEPDQAAPPERPRPRAAPAPANEPPPPLSPEEVARWLERTGDDPSRALRALREEGSERRRSSPW